MQESEEDTMAWSSRLTALRNSNSSASEATAKPNATRGAGAIAESNAIQGTEEVGRNRGNVSKQTMARHEKLHRKYKVLHEDFNF
jgi:hypothetical protein